MRLFALVDCSAFYCSCEQSFRPDLAGEPVVVLSNNDGCVIARNDEAKGLGVEMGAPYFQVRRELDRKGVHVFSSNYTLYADISRRVMSILERFSPDVERYSIDEAFMVFNVNEHDEENERRRMADIAAEIRRTVWRSTGVPVRVSMAETKTLAKVGSDYAKLLLKHGREPCVCFWQHPHKERYLNHLPVKDVWGVGRRWGEKLERMGARTAGGLAALPDSLVRMSYNVQGLRTAMELRGLSCIPLERFAEPRKSMVRSRMFGKPLTDPRLILQAVAAHTSRAAEKLRAEKLVAGSMEVLVTTGKHTRPLRRGSATGDLLHPTSDTITLVKHARRLFDQCFLEANRKGERYRYNKAGVMLFDLMDEGMRQTNFFEDAGQHHPEINKAIDAINRRFGKKTIVLGATGSPKPQLAVESGAAGAVKWGMKREKMSPRYTTEWAEIPTVRATFPAGLRFVADARPEGSAAG